MKELITIENLNEDLKLELIKYSRLYAYKVFYKNKLIQVVTDKTLLAVRMRLYEKFDYIKQTIKEEN